MGILLTSGKRDFILDPVWTNVTGMLGFSDETRQTIDLSHLGAFVTNAISLSPRKPARPPRILTFPGGFLLHTGHPNPGLSQAIRQHARRWSDLPCPIIVHLLGQNAHDISQMVERLEDVEAVIAVEIGLEESDPDIVSRLTSEAVKGELPILIQVAMDSPEEILLAIAEAGAGAISLGPPRGTLPSPKGEFVSGRLFGPGLFPTALQSVSKLRSQVDIPIIASGGLYASNQVKAMLEAGASGVQFDSVLWTEPEPLFSDLNSSVEENEILPPA